MALLPEDLDPCVRAILCAFEGPTRTAIQGLFTPLIVQLDIDILLLQQKALQYNVLAAAAQITVGLLEDLLARLKAGLSVIPISLIAGCIDIGDSLLFASATIDAQTAQIEAQLQDAIRLLSYADELNLLVAQYQQYRDLFQAMLDTINLC